MIRTIAENVGGFKFNQARNVLELRGSLKSEPCAHLEYEGGFNVREFHVVVLNNYSTDHNAFSRVMKAARKMAESLASELLDDDFEPMTEEREAADKQRVEAHIDAREKAAKVITKLPDGTLLERGPVSFNATIRTKRGAWLREEYFDVPALGFHDGQIEGFRCSLELLTMLKNETASWRTRQLVERMLQEAGACGRYQYDKVSKANVADAILEVVSEALFYFSQSANFDEWLRRRITDAENSKVFFQESIAQERAAAIENMRRGREAAAARRKAEAEAKEQRRQALDDRKAPGARKAVRA